MNLAAKDNMAWTEEIMGKNGGKFALTGGALTWQPVSHALFSMACRFIIES
jgi:hypothetical protein